MEIPLKLELLFVSNVVLFGGTNVYYSKHYYFYGEQKYQYVGWLVLVIALAIFYIWRFFYQMKKKKEVKKPT